MQALYAKNEKNRLRGTISSVVAWQRAIMVVSLKVGGNSKNQKFSGARKSVVARHSARMVVSSKVGGKATQGRSPAFYTAKKNGRAVCLHRGCLMVASPKTQ
jgi:hypothetical protein